MLPVLICKTIMIRSYCFLIGTFGFLIAGFHPEAAAQGCSDAGFCTMEAFKPGAAGTQRSHLKTGISAGSADLGVTVTGAFIEYGRKLNDKLSLEAKLTALRQQGNGIAATGLSDIFLSSSYALSKPVQVSLGVKLPLSGGNRFQNGLPLPMDYQASLGTVDLITGISGRLGKWQLAAAWQQPLKQNSNAFLPELYPAGSTLRKFTGTRLFKRSGDVLLRATYALQISKAFSITPGLLPILHLGDDRFTGTNGTEQVIKGSGGLTLNGNLFLDYRVSDSNSLQLTAGAPFIVRDTRPDGLTRSFIAGLEYQIRF